MMQISKPVRPPEANNLTINVLQRFLPKILPSTVPSAPASRLSAHTETAAKGPVVPVPGSQRRSRRREVSGGLRERSEEGTSVRGNLWPSQKTPVPLTRPRSHAPRSETYGRAKKLTMNVLQTLWFPAYRVQDCSIHRTFGTGESPLGTHPHTHTHTHTHTNKRRPRGLCCRCPVREEDPDEGKSAEVFGNALKRVRACAETYGRVRKHRCRSHAPAHTPPARKLMAERRS
jgi:hypothetical protein